MNLNNLKPAWKQLRLYNSMQPIDQHEILLILERAEGIAVSKNYRSLISIMMVAVLTFCCQGG
jgi:hypothetical protein